MFTNTPDGHFILDHHPANSKVRKIKADHRLALHMSSCSSWASAICHLPITCGPVSEWSMTNNMRASRHIAGLRLFATCLSSRWHGRPHMHSGGPYLAFQAGQQTLPVSRSRQYRRWCSARHARGTASSSAPWSARSSRTLRSMATPACRSGCTGSTPHGQDTGSCWRRL